MTDKSAPCSLHTPLNYSSLHTPLNYSSQLISLSPHYRKRASNSKNTLLENTPAESIIDDTVPFTSSNGHLTEHTTADSGHYGSVGATDETLEVSANDK